MNDSPADESGTDEDATDVVCSAVLEVRSARRLTGDVGSRTNDATLRIVLDTLAEKVPLLGVVGAYADVSSGSCGRSRWFEPTRSGVELRNEKRRRGSPDDVGGGKCDSEMLARRGASRRPPNSLVRRDAADAAAGGAGATRGWVSDQFGPITVTLDQNSLGSTSWRIGKFVLGSLPSSGRLAASSGWS